MIRVSNHPVHFVTNGGELSPSAFIPFCEFGGNMSAMGVKIDQFDVPVCNSFQAKIVNDQLCYEVDLNKFSKKGNIEKELKSGFVFFLDYNEDRQTPYEVTKRKDMSFVGRIVTSEEEQAAIYLNNIGKKMLFLSKYF